MSWSRGRRKKTGQAQRARLLIPRTHADATLAPALFMALRSSRERPLPNPECSEPRSDLAIALVKIPPSTAAHGSQDRMQGVTWAHSVPCMLAQPPEVQLTQCPPRSGIQSCCLAFGSSPQGLCICCSLCPSPSQSCSSFGSQVKCHFPWRPHVVSPTLSSHEAPFSCKTLRRCLAGTPTESSS